MALLLPVLLMAAVEVFLRLANYGYPTSFFLRQRVNGREMLIDNGQFGWRFFPKELARTPQPVMFPARKEPGTIRIFVLGESAAMGDPEPAFGLPRMLQTMLELKFPSNRFEVINVAMTAINSHVIREIAKDIAPLEGDAWVIYMGNNEVVGPFGAGTIFTRQTPSRAFIRATLWLKRFRLVQALSSIGVRPTEEWGGMEMFLEQQVRIDHPRMKTVREHFRRNLRDIVQRGKEAGSEVVAGTVAVNVRDCPPFASQHSAVLSRSDEAKWREAMDAGMASAGQGAFAAAYSILTGLQQRFATNYHAELAFHLARCALATGETNEAQVRFNFAREFDTLRFRADEWLNQIIRKTASASGCTLVDCEKIVSQRSASGIPGDESFYEHVHFNFEGTYVVARGFFDALVHALPPALTNGAVSGIPSLGDCARRLAWTDWDRLQVYEEVRKRLQQPPFTAQFGHAERDRAWQQRIDELRASLTPGKLAEIVAQYRDALGVAPRDWVLRENFAKLLEANGDATAALEQWNEVARLLPHDVQSQYHLGNLLDSVGRSEEALGHFYAALRRNPSSVETRQALALALGNLGRTEAAQREFELVLRQKPKFTEARVNFGQFLARQGKSEAAAAQYELALRHDTNSTAAHVNLGKLLNQRGDKAGAIRHYEAALRINPRHAIAHFNLANALQATDPARAVRHYAEAVAAKADFVEARIALGVALAGAGNVREAETHFAEAVRLRPDSAEAHFNYGVLLANTKRFAEAAKAFSRALELEPNHERARQFLARVQGR